MGMPAFNSSVLSARLSKLDAAKVIAFGVLCCERLLPNYSVFQDDAGWGDLVGVRTALDCICGVLEGESENSLVIAKHIAVCESAVPHSEDFSSLFVTAAQDACFSVCSLLDYLQDKNVDRVVQVANYSTDSVDLYVQEIEGLSASDPRLELKILSHPLMQRELSQQENDMVSLECVDLVDRRFMTSRRDAWNSSGRGNLALE